MHSVGAEIWNPVGVGADLGTRQLEPPAADIDQVDAVGAGVGEMVLYATGSSARQTKATEARPCDAVIMAIVDSWEIEGESRYMKGRDD